MSCYFGFSTLTKAAFAFSILTLLCTHFEQTSSHLNPIHQRAPPPPLDPTSFLGFLDVIQTSTGLLKSQFVNAQKVSFCLPTFTMNLIYLCLRGANRPLCNSLLP